MNSVRRTLAGLSVLSCLLATTAVVAAPLNVELKDLVTKHPKVLGATKTVTSSDQALQAALGGYYPTIALTGTYGFEHINNPTRRSTNQDPWDLPRQEAGITVTQKLFDKSLPASVRSARYTLLNSGIEAERTTQETILEGIKAYVDVLKLSQLVSIAQSNVATIQEQAELEDERVQRGSGISLDVLRAKSHLKDARRRLVEFQRLQEEAFAKFYQTFDKAPEIGTMIDPEPPLDLLPPTLEEAIDIAQGENPSVSSGNAQIEIAAENKTTQAAAYLPTVNLVGAANYEKDNNVVIGIRRDISVMVEASWEVFNGFATRARVAGAAADYGAAKDNLDYVIRKVEEQVKIAWHELQTSRERLEILDNAVVIAQEVFDSTRELREEGAEDVLNVLDAERDVYLAQLEKVIANYDTKMAVYNLLYGMGRLTMQNLDN
ncbi:TolC family outer membrane protein [Magnetospira sp. QH-2]|uniref:TolC family outer membrane protein n=1 Tax=Magnetospira sp. (strain QH-2) TaxID=1288970 RepID=UPI0003E81B1D|nr:TolC family outer membrane protein [Magnetospira sp. QH-2]CCQ73433.1 Putative outer membrane efflux protein [Magnetospira sp. QH-2]